MQDAVAQHRQGRLREAEKLYGRVLKSAPNHFDALHLLGLVKAQAGQMGEAHRLMSAALAINGQAPDVLINFANVLHALKRDHEALACLDKALAIKPEDLQALGNRASALLTLDRPREALAALDVLLERSPRDVDALVNRGCARAALALDYHREGQAAEAHADSAAANRFYQNAAQHSASALADFDAALAVAPQNADAHYNRGNALAALDRPAEAVVAFERATAAAPKNAEAWFNLGRALQALNRHRDALASFDKALGLQKTNADAHFNRALTLLTLGELRAGFEEYEWRWKRSGMTDARRRYSGPLWLGEYPLAHRTILLHAEQGLGDTIQFARYAPLVARGGATVVLEVQPELKTLLAHLEGVASCHARGEPLPPYDVHCPLGSLPLAVKTEPASIPADIPYLRADASRLEKWRQRLAALPGKRVALSWAGNASHVNDRNRSLDLALLEPLLSLEGISFVSIQRELRAYNAEFLASHANVTHLGDELIEMADTAAVTALADLTLAVDTAVVHLAGSLGRPLWVMVPFRPDWRWTLAGEHSPWYPQARLFRQPTLADWPSVVANVRAELARLIAA